MAQLAPLPPPGLAVFPNLIAQQPEILVMKGEWVGSSYTITTMSGQRIMAIDPESLSASHRRHVIDAKGRRLCDIRKETWTTRTHYYAETVEGGPHLFDLESHSHLISATTNTIIFANAATPGLLGQLECKDKTLGTGCAVMYGGQPVAAIEKIKFKMKDEYHLSVTAGLDMFLVVAIAVILDDIARDSDDGASSLGHAAGAALGGGGA